jgi:hypothetical protein
VETRSRYPAGFDKDSTNFLAVFIYESFVGKPLLANYCNLNSTMELAAVMKGQEASTTGICHRDERMLGEEVEDGISDSLCWPARGRCCQFAQRVLGTSSTERAGGKGGVRGGVI